MPYVALQQEGNANMQLLLEKAQNHNYNVIVVPINVMDVPTEFEHPPLNDAMSSVRFTYGDLLLTCDQWNGKVIIMLSDTIDCDSLDTNVRKFSEDILLRDISWAEHLQYCGYTMIKLKQMNNMNLTRILCQKIKGVVLIQIPMYNALLAKSAWRRDISEKEMLAMENQNDTWHWWNRIRWAADYNPKLKVVLELNDGTRPNLNEIMRWLGEPLEAVIIPSTMFIRNRQNFPVLPRAWQNILKHFTQCHVNIIVSTHTADENIKLYSNYLNNFKELYKDGNELHSFEDVLEVPLQPLYDNLDCYTYEIFEKDPVKYKFYQNAIVAALKDRVSDIQAEEDLVVIMVLGAGRGPLVRAALNAAEITKRRVRIYIIEKNPSAIRTLSAIANKLWFNKDVQLFAKDMREFAPPEQADILISELLGSFGDNELSPECLDCAQRLLKSNGISIPCRSTSYINPIMSSKLFTATRQIARNETFGRDKQATYYTHAESGFVVLLKNIYNIAKPQALFEFVHPNRNDNIDNRRYKILNFEAQLDCVLNGIGGYFDCVLYNDITLSINPCTHTPGMPSWFPMYFPFTDPINIKKGQTIEIHFWRCITKQKVWYEWCLAAPVTTHIHNLGGRSCPIYCT